MSIFQEIKELRMQLATFNLTTTTQAEIDKFIELIKTKVDINDYPKKIYHYCKDNENYKKLIKLGKQLRNRLEKKDVHICIEGETGCGKSTFTLILYGILCYLLEKKFNLCDNVIYKPLESELSKKLDILFNDILWIDESIKSLNKMKYHNKDVIESNENIQTERYRHNIVIYCIPHFNELVKSFRDGNIKMRIWCIGFTPHSAAVLWIKEKHPMLIQKYGAWHNDDIAMSARDARINPLSSTTEYLNFERTKNAIYADDYEWPDMANLEEFGLIHLLYDAYKLRSRIMEKKEVKTIVKETKREKKFKVGLIQVAKMMKKESELNTHQFAEKYAKTFNIEPSTIEHWLVEKEENKAET